MSAAFDHLPSRGGWCRRNAIVASAAIVQIDQYFRGSLLVNMYGTGCIMSPLPDLTCYESIRERRGRLPMPGEGGDVTIAQSPHSIRRGADASEHDPTGIVDGRAGVVTDLFHEYAARVYGYARLRSTAETAEDVVADTFLTAWRLRDRIPADPLPWLLVVARNALSNRRRAETRSTRLHAAMATIDMLAAHPPSTEDLVTDREALLSAVALLTDEERDALILTAWDGLTQREAAQVAGCTQATMARRLRRARHHLTTALTSTGTEQPDGPVGATGPELTRPAKEKP